MDGIYKPSQPMTLHGRCGLHTSESLIMLLMTARPEECTTEAGKVI